MDNMFYTISNYLIASILILSVGDKIKNWNKNSAKIEAYKILHVNLITPFNILLLIIEIYLGLTFLLMKSSSLDIALFIMLMLIYTSAIGINLYRGNVRISCGCGGVLENDHLTSFLIYRNITLILISLVIFYGESSEFVLFEYFNALLLALTILMIYGASNEYFQQKYIIERIKPKLLFFN